MKKIIIVISAILYWATILSAGILDELNHVPPQQEFLLYIDVRTIFDYAQKKGISPDDLPYYFGEKQYADAEKILNKFNTKVSDIHELLVAGKLEDQKKDLDALVIIRYAGNTRPIPPEFKSMALSTPNGTIYDLKGDNGKTVMFAQTKDSFVIGMREPLEYFLKSKKTAISSGKTQYAEFREQSRGKCFYAHLSVGKVMKDHMDGAVKKGASMGKGLNANVFIKSIMALKSIDVSVQFGKRIQYYVDMRASSKEDGDRLMMVSHFFIVGASLAISFIDILGKSFGDGNSGGFQEKEMETIQGFFGRIGTRQVDKGVLLSFHLTEDETNMFITSAKKKIASEKNAQGIRLEREALATFINTIKKGDAAEVTAFLSKKININGKDINGNIPLHTACVAGKFNIVRLLVEKGAEINSQDFDMKTPLHRAVESGNPDIVAYILAKGANVQAKSISGNTPLHDNAIQGNEKITGLLIGKHADVNAKNQMGASPLHLASEHGHLIVVKALVEKGADINAYDNMGDRAIDRARRMEKHDIVNYLIERESNPLNSGDGNSSDGEGSSKQGDY